MFIHNRLLKRTETGMNTENGERERERTKRGNKRSLSLIHWIDLSDPLIWFQPNPSSVFYSLLISIPLCSPSHFLRLSCSDSVVVRRTWVQLLLQTSPLFVSVATLNASASPFDSPFDSPFNWFWGLNEWILLLILSSFRSTQSFRPWFFFFPSHFSCGRRQRLKVNPSLDDLSWGYQFLGSFSSGCEFCRWSIIYFYSQHPSFIFFTSCCCLLFLLINDACLSLSLHPFIFFHLSSMI